MALASRLKWYLDANEIPYEVVHHERTRTAREAAHKAHVPEGRVAKCVLLEDERGYLLAIVPASRDISIDALDDLLQRDFELATEPELAQIFGDCAVGAVPATGEPYNVPMFVDDTLLKLPDLYFDGGDHEDLVHLSHDAFERLAKNSKHGRICKPH